MVEAMASWVLFLFEDEVAGEDVKAVEEKPGFVEAAVETWPIMTTDDVPE